MQQRRLSASDFSHHDERVVVFQFQVDVGQDWSEVLIEFKAVFERALIFVFSNFEAPGIRAVRDYNANIFRSLSDLSGALMLRHSKHISYAVHYTEKLKSCI